MGRRLILEGPYKGRSVILQKYRFTNGVCDISHISPEDALKIGQHMATFYQARMEDDLLSPPPKVEEAKDAATESAHEVRTGAPVGGSAGTPKEAPARLEPDAGAESRRPSVPGKPVRGPGDAKGN